MTKTLPDWLLAAGDRRQGRAQETIQDSMKFLADEYGLFTITIKQLHATMQHQFGYEASVWAAQQALYALVEKNIAVRVKDGLFCLREFIDHPSVSRLVKPYALTS